MKLPVRERCQTIRLVSNSTKSLPQVKSELALNPSRETIRWAIHECPNFVQAKMNKALNLKPIHKENHIKFVQESMTYDYNQVIW